MTAMSLPAPSPYQQAAHHYLTNGWRSVLPLPHGQKFPPPTGFTGIHAPEPTVEQYKHWLTDISSGNIALRMPDGIIGLDVDAYGDKPGATTLQMLELELGYLPQTWRTTSRDDGSSGIRFFQTPTGLDWPSIAGPGIDIIQTGHRYALVWPSTHPNGGTYRWIDPNDTDHIGAGPALTDLPALPAAWVAHLTQGRRAAQPKQPRTDQPPIHYLTDGQPCGRVRELLDEFDQIMDGTAGSRHDLCLPLTFKLVAAGAAGHQGVAQALDTCRNIFTIIIGADRGNNNATREWDSMVDGAAQQLEPPIPDVCLGAHCSHFLPELDIHPTPQRQAVQDSLMTLPEEAAERTRDDIEAAAQAARDLRYARLLEEELEKQQARSEAKRTLADRDARDRYQLPTHTRTLTEELALPDQELNWTINELWPEGANITLTAQYKAGKTSTINSILKSLADGTPLFGRWGINHPGRTAVWNYEVSDRQYRTWLRERDIHNTDHITVLNMRGTRWPLIHDTVTQQTITWLTEHNITTWIIDPLARAFVGCGDENSNQDVGVFLDTLDYIKEQAGVKNLLIAAHTGRNAELGNSRARGASRFDDWADVRWMLRKDPENDLRYFSADGRDVYIEESQLEYDEANRSQTIHIGITKAIQKEHTVTDKILKVLRQHPGGMSANKLHQACIDEYGKGSGFSLDQSYDGGKNPLRRMVDKGEIVREGNIYRALIVTARLDD